MKICYLSDANSVHTKKWCNYFKGIGYEIYVISLNPGKIEDVEVYYFDHGEISKKSQLSKLKYFTRLNSIKKIIKKINPDVLHAHYASSYGLLGALVNFHPYIVSVWGKDVFDFPTKSIAHKKSIEYVLKKADKILSTSKVMAIETNKYTNKNVVVTPFGVDTNKYKPNNEYKDDEKIIIGTVKTLDPKYGVDYLIKSFANTVKNNPDKCLELHIAGKGDQKQELIELSKNLDIYEKVKFLGFLSEEEVINTFNSFDIAAFPSIFDSESFGVAAVEAGACGVPVIVSNVGGLPEATKPNVSSIVVEKENISELTSALDKLINNQKLRKKMGTAGRQYVIENFDIKDNFGKVNDIYIKTSK